MVEIHVEGAVTHPGVNGSLLAAQKLYVSVKLLLRILEKRCRWDQLTEAKNSFVILFLNKNVGY